MDSRKVSSLSVKSDGSDSSLPRGSNLILEEIGSIPITEVIYYNNLSSKRKIRDLLGWVMMGSKQNLDL